MAVLKEITLPSGAKASYWKVLPKWEVANDIVTAYVSGYANADYREQNAPPVADTLRITLPFSEMTHGDYRPDIYTFLKGEGEMLEGGEDA